jgi:hypothetical protein
MKLPIGKNVSAIILLTIFLSAFATVGYAGILDFGGGKRMLASVKSVSGVNIAGRTASILGSAPQQTLLFVEPLTRSAGDKKAFTVKFIEKSRRTAIGVSATKLADLNTYLTPDYYSGSDYVSMGGAGYFYPSRSRATKGYAEGDTVRVEVDFAGMKVHYQVNGVAVGSALLKNGSDGRDSVYPFISCEGGPITMEVEYD